MTAIKCQVIYKEGEMIQWLYKYFFRGIGVLFLIGMITALFLAISSQARRPANSKPPAAAPAAAHR